MTPLVEASRRLRVTRLGFIIAFGVVLLLVVLAILDGNHPQSSVGAALPSSVTPQPAFDSQVAAGAYSQAAFGPKTPALMEKAEIADQQLMMVKARAPDAAAARRIVRTASLEMLVQHPEEVADRITALAEKLGGYLVSADGGGQNLTTARLTVRVPAAQFEPARAEIRALGLRVENEKFEAQDVTRQYVDQEASIRNLQAEEMQYLAILQQAHTVNDMVYISEKLTQVRGQIEKQQAEFSALAHQAETVAIAIALRTEAERQVLGLNWHPLGELRAAGAEGLASVVSYGMAMMTILFYLPAALLWVGTILLAAVYGWRGLRWARRRWAESTMAGGAAQG